VTRYAVIELGKLLGLWLVAAVVLAAGVGVLLWLVVFVSAHVLALVYRLRGYRASVLRDGIAVWVRRVPRRVETVTVVARNPYSPDGTWRSERGFRYIERPTEDAGNWISPVDHCRRRP
jgi:hypothetical protein